MSAKLEDFIKNSERGFTFIQKLWMLLCKEKQCIWCSKVFPDGLVKKHPKKEVPLSAYFWFTSEYLVHCQTTHGFSPDVIDYFLEELSKRIRV